MELKTSSQRLIYGNRSYVKSDSGKDKSGYYVTINFERITKKDPEILLIKMGWLDHMDWQGQISQTGQQASITKNAWEKKLVVLHKFQININTADSERLQTLDGVGPATAQKIIEFRERHGEYKKVGELSNVKGLRSDIVDHMKESVII